MLNRTIILVTILISGITLSSCSSKFSLTKRRYTKGYYFDVAKTKKIAKGKANEAETEAKTIVAKNPQPASDNSQQQKSAETVGNSHSVLHTESSGHQALAIAPVTKATKNGTAINYAKPQFHTSFQKINQAKKLSAQTGQNNSQAPYELLGSGGVLAYIVGAFISIIFSFLFFFLIFAIIDGLLPVWLISFLVFLLVIAIVAIIVVVVVNSD